MADAPEEWREILGYPNYRVSSMGRVMSNYAWGKRGRTGDWRLLNPYINEDGYAQVALSRYGQAKSILVHVLVLEAFVGPRPEGLIGCHNNGNPSDNRLDNLRWGTYESNSADQVVHGTALRGERAANAKLTNGQVREIRALLATGSLLQRDIAKTYGVSQTCISEIKHGRKWRFVE